MTKKLDIPKLEVIRVFVYGERIEIRDELDEQQRLWSIGYSDIHSWTKPQAWALAYKWLMERKEG